jgi:5'-3' exonuclease
VESLLSLLHDPAEAVSHIAVVFDNPIRSFRNDLFPPYKSDEGVPSELRSQFDAAEHAVRSIGVAVWSNALVECASTTPDKDLGQCLHGECVVQVDRRQKKVVNETLFRAERGFGPASLPDFLALTGDSADGIPGLAGFGKKSAALLLGVYERLERIPANPLQWKVKPCGALRLAATLVARRDEAFLYRQLATLIDTVPLEGSLEDLRFHGVARGRFERWCDNLGVVRLKTAPRRWH